MTAVTTDAVGEDGRVGPLDVLSAAFAGLLRRCGVAVSPAEAIEIRRAMIVLGGADLERLRSGLRAVAVSYAHERVGFEAAYDAFFLGITADDAAAAGHRPDADVPDGRLPEGLELDEDDPMSRYTDYNPRAAEVGDHIEAPEAEKGFNPHKDDDDLSLSTSDADLSVRSGDEGRRGVTYTVDLERAGSAVAGELTSTASAMSSGELSLDDPAAVLSWLEEVDARTIYRDGLPGEREHLTDAQMGSLVAAIEAFVDALAGRVADLGMEEPGQGVRGEAVDRSTLRRACYDLLHRMRGAPRTRPIEGGRGHLDVRRTVRRSLRTDGVPFHLVARTPRPDKVRVVVVADVSLSVRTVKAFVLRLAQTLHATAHRCRVLAFVDTPVDVTDVLLRSSGDAALPAVLATPGLDLDATSDYGRVLRELADGRGPAAAALDSRTTLLVVGDARCNGLPPGTEHLRRLRSKVHRLGWITPEPRRYWTQASCALPVYSEIVDHVLVARDGEEFAEGAAEMGHALA